MTVRFKGSSEYQQTYKWNDSIKSASFIPPEEMVAADAGKPSFLTYKCEEPPLQHKKRIPDPYETQNLLKSAVYDLPDESPASRTAVPATPDAPRPSNKPIRNQKTVKPVIAEYPHANPSPYLSSGDSKTVAVKPKHNEMRLDPIATEQPERSNSHVYSQNVKDNVRAGIEPIPRPSRSAKRSIGGVQRSKTIQPRSSEYDRQFRAWEYFPKPKPVLDNTEIVYKSHAGIPPYALDNVKRSSEYDAQFKNWVPVVNAIASKQSRDTRRVSKSGGTTAEASRWVQSSMKPIPPAVCNYSMKKYHTEYQDRFKEGSQKVPIENKGPSGKMVNPTALVEDTKQLREMAAHYGARHLGSHISRDHLGQLISSQADNWDYHSNSENLANALDLAKPSKKQKLVSNLDRDAAGLPSKIGEPSSLFEKPMKGISLSPRVSAAPNNKTYLKPQKSTKVNKKESDILLVEDIEIPAVVSSAHDEADMVFSPKDLANGFHKVESGDGVESEQEQQVDNSLQDSARSTLTAASQISSRVSANRSRVELGRVPTPEIVKHVKDNKTDLPKQRHHLDRTTVITATSQPAESSEKQKSSTLFKSNRRSNPEVGSGEAHKLYHTMAPAGVVTIPKSSPLFDSPRSMHKTVPLPQRAKVSLQPQQQKQQPRGIYGKPTSDTHAILLNVPLVERHAPESQQSPEPVNDQSYEQFSYHETSNGNTLQLPLKVGQLKDEDDKVSVASILSQRSIASDILERSKKRRDEMKATMK